MYECDKLCVAGNMGNCPKPCTKIAGYPTFCCPADESCSRQNNIDVGYAKGYMKTIIADTIKAKCDSNPEVSLPSVIPFCPVSENSTEALA